MASTRNKLSRQDIRAILKRGKRITQSGLTLVYQETKKSASRLTVVIGAKTEKRATRRNRARRCLKEAVFSHLTKHPFLFDGVIFIKYVPGAITTRDYASPVALLFDMTRHHGEAKS